MHSFTPRIVWTCLLCLDGRQLHAITTKPKVLYCRAAALVECYSASIGTCNRFERVADISSSQESLRGRTRDVARSAFQDEAATSVEEFE